MNVTVTSEQRFGQAPDGTVWTPGQCCYGFMRRYLEVFDQVTVVARVKEVGHVASGWKRADGRSVRFCPVPYFVGPWEYVRRLFQIKRLLRDVAVSTEAAILRVPSILATHLVKMLYRKGHPYGLEVIGDPWDVFAPGVIRHPLRPYFRARSWALLKNQCREAQAVAYVTKEALQLR